ncbi:MAG: hypothetical protein MUP80_03185 [Acidobacteriia bacterium]|nr:hypothetical protein [Terriglobia bacterium]
MTRTIPLVLASILLSVLSATSQEKAMDVCALLKSERKYDGKIVVVTGYVRATQHLTAIRSEGCPRSVIIRYKSDAQPDEFVAGVEDTRLWLDPRPFRVTVEGRFQRRVRGPLGYFSRIEVTRALSWDFIGEKTTVNPPVQKPQ